MKSFFLFITYAISQKNYIVVLKETAKVNEYMEAMKQNDGYQTAEKEIHEIYDTEIFKGYAGKFSQKALDEIQKSEDLDFIEEDKIMKATLEQLNAPWGLARLSSQNRQTSSTGTYHHHPDSGKGVNAYVIDTGVNIRHVDFQGRAVWGTNTAKGSSNEDRNGHGTHVAGTIGGQTYGVAKNVKLIAVKVLGDDGSGTNSGVIKGIEWAALHAKRNGGSKGNVANMSLGGGYSKALNMAVQRASRFLTFAVAAGNDNTNACKESPASEPSAITVAASTIADVKANFSNYGRCVDIIAPGQGILSAWIGSNTATNTISGTSMASPHVAGMIANILSLPSKTIPVQSVHKLVVMKALKGKISGFGQSTPNLLAHV